MNRDEMADLIEERWYLLGDTVRDLLALRDAFLANASPISASTIGQAATLVGDARLLLDTLRRTQA